MAVATTNGIEAFWRGIALVFIAIFLLAGDAVSVSREEYLKLERQLKSLNKPSVISIKTAYRDIFDCVDIYKQPALDHPSLKDHEIQMWPTSFPKTVESNKTSETRATSEMGMKARLPGGGCPNGTVPIRRIRMQDLLRSGSGSLSKFGTKAVTKDDVRDNHQWATVSAPSGQYYGTLVNMNVWSPSVADPKQFSLGQFWLTSGEVGTSLNSIEAGWMVNPGLFADNRPRLFVYWTADDYKNTGCYNTKCSGFVQVSNEIAPGIVLQSSSYNGQQNSITLQAFKDVKTGNWWLTYGDNNEKVVGYWPKSLFNLLADRASNVRWGGEIFTAGLPKQPQMGSGHFPNEGFGKAAFMRMIMTVDENNALRDAPSGPTLISKPNCYNLDNPSQFGGGGWRRFFYFGGPGC